MNILNKTVFSKDSVRKKHSEKETDNKEIGESFANAMHDHSVLPYEMAWLLYKGTSEGSEKHLSFPICCIKAEKQWYLLEGVILSWCKRYEDRQLQEKFLGQEEAFEQLGSWTI